MERKRARCNNPLGRRHLRLGGVATKGVSRRVPRSHGASAVLLVPSRSAQRLHRGRAVRRGRRRGRPRLHDRRRARRRGHHPQRYRSARQRCGRRLAAPSERGFYSGFSALRSRAARRRSEATLPLHCPHYHRPRYRQVPCRFRISSRATTAPRRHGRHRWPHWTASRRGKHPSSRP